MGENGDVRKGCPGIQQVYEMSFFFFSKQETLLYRPTRDMHEISLMMLRKDAVPSFFAFTLLSPYRRDFQIEGFGCHVSCSTHRGLGFNKRGAKASSISLHPQRMSCSTEFKQKTCFFCHFTCCAPIVSHVAGENPPVADAADSVWLIFPRWFSVRPGPDPADAWHFPVKFSQCAQGRQEKRNRCPAARSFPLFRTMDGTVKKSRRAPEESRHRRNVELPERTWRKEWKKSPPQG